MSNITREENVVHIVTHTDAGVYVRLIKLHMYSEEHLLELRSAIDLEIGRRDLEKQQKPTDTD